LLKKQRKTLGGYFFATSMYSNAAVDKRVRSIGAYTISYSSVT